MLLLVVPFIPCSNLLTYVGALKAERWLYLPCLGFCLLASLGLRGLVRSCTRKGSGRQGWLHAVAVCIVVGLYAQRTADRDRVWADPLELWGSAAKVTPTSAQAHVAFGRSLINAGHHDAAVESFKRVTALKQEDQGDVNIDFDMARALIFGGRDAEALQVCEEALQRTHQGPRPGLTALRAIVEPDSAKALHFADLADTQLRRLPKPDAQISGLIDFARRKALRDKEEPPP